MEQIRVALEGQDELRFEPRNDGFKVFVIGCLSLQKKVQELRTQYGADPRAWALPQDVDHASLLLKEFILRCQGKWIFPYQDVELCHCRMVPTAKVDQAILQGCHTPEQVSHRTSASMSCGTCRPDVEKIIKYRLGTAS